MSDNFFFSFSVPRIINSKGDAGLDIQTYERHYYLMSSYLFEVKPGFQIKPSILVRGVTGVPPSFDINLSFLINNMLWAGAFTRNLNTYGLMAQFEFKDAYKIGYSFEILNNSFSGNSLPTHEIMISGDLAIFDHQHIFQRYF